MNEAIALQLLAVIDSLEHQVGVVRGCCGCGRGGPEDDIDRLRDLIEIYREGPKRPGY